VLQVHYHRTGKEERDRTRLEIYFAKGPVREPVQTAMVPGLFARIPAGEPNFVVDRTARVTEDVTLYWLTPHMHLRGKSIELTATYPDGRSELLVRVRDWDYNWQEMYQLKEPKKLPAGTLLHLHAVFDNSAANPLNPSRPPKDVRFGEQTTDEMCFVFLGLSSPNPGWRKVTPVPFARR